ncbi:hypothetical protein KAFR_0C00360 [Kazachstania africana CBS 2517]|uniref:Uncharacterized protein n=1 Tax=Kazachstania africana (strain ATCC 22294 / BCRC 22015 / CBS 2517 / CECT 1963 / NBRC 1671 / NRRL Y-8276) TaxID=1071382 RepID=H2ARN2_KAZAF|nr:hypothetical protein KAFR_0C00360 [Kazachstania africana CBS 2517]CCF57032.1 hypothetical protein KAFR_0C00360 [Kazachstania africana CBS 2517]
MEDLESLTTDILRACGSMALEMELSTTAINIFSRLLQKNPFDVEALLLLTSGYFETRNYIGVIHTLLGAVNSSESAIVNDFRIWKQLAVSYYKLRRCDDAIHAVDQALSLVQAHNEKEVALDRQQLYLLKCRISILEDSKTQNIEQLLRKFEDAIAEVQDSNTPYHVEILLSRAQLLKKHRRYQHCEDDLLSIIKILSSPPSRLQFKPQDILNKINYVCHLLVSINVLMNSTDEMNIANEPLHLQTWGTVLGQLQTALSSFQHTTSSSHKLKILMAQLRCLSNIDLQVTVEMLNNEVLVSSGQHCSSLYYMIARVLLKLDGKSNIYQAYECFQKALNLTPERPCLWISVASLYLRLGQLDDALSTYSQAVHLALSIDSGSDKLCNGHQDDSLKQHHKMCYNLFAAFGWFGISQVYTATGDFSQAIDAIGQAIKIFKIADDIRNINNLELVHSKLLIYEARRKRGNSAHTSNLTVTEKIRNKDSSVPPSIDYSSTAHLPMPSVASSSSMISSELSSVTDLKQNVDNLSNGGNLNRLSTVSSQVEYDYPDIPIELLIDFETYCDDNAFLIEGDVMKYKPIFSGTTNSHNREYTDTSRIKTNDIHFTLNYSSTIQAPPQTGGLLYQSHLDRLERQKASYPDYSSNSNTRSPFTHQNHPFTEQSNVQTKQTPYAGPFTFNPSHSLNHSSQQPIPPIVSNENTLSNNFNSHMQMEALNSTSIRAANYPQSNVHSHRTLASYHPQARPSHTQSRVIRAPQFNAGTAGLQNQAQSLDYTAGNMQNVSMGINYPGHVPLLPLNVNPSTNIPHNSYSYPEQRYIMEQKQQYYNNNP